jgi:hypothetical protein
MVSVTPFYDSAALEVDIPVRRSLDRFESLLTRGLGLNAPKYSEEEVRVLSSRQRDESEIFKAVVGAAYRGNKDNKLMWDRQKKEVLSAAIGEFASRKPEKAELATGTRARTMNYNHTFQNNEL